MDKPQRRSESRIACRSAGPRLDVSDHDKMRLAVKTKMALGTVRKWTKGDPSVSDSTLTKLDEAMRMLGIPRIELPRKARRRDVQPEAVSQSYVDPEAIPRSA